MSSDTRMVLQNPQPSAEWPRADIEIAIRCIRLIHRHGRVLNLWELALEIHLENERRYQTRIGNTAFVIHERVVDLFNRFESCMENIVNPSCRTQPCDHHCITAETAPYTMKERLLRKLEWFYELYAVLGKQLKFVSGLPVERSQGRIGVIKDEVKLPVRRRGRSSTERLGGCRTARNSMRSYGDLDRGYRFRHGESDKNRPKYDSYPIEVSTTTRKRPISRDEQEESNSKKPRKDPEIGSQATYERFGNPRPQKAESQIFPTSKFRDVSAHQLIEDILTDSQEKEELSTSQTPLPSNLEAGRNKSPDEEVLTDSFEERGSVKQLTKATECLERKKAIVDTFMELGQLFYKRDTNHQSGITNGQTETLERINELEVEINHRYSDLIARQEELAQKDNLTEAETKKFHSDLMKQIQDQHSEHMNQFLRQEKHVQHNYVQAMKVLDQHQKEMLSKKETQEREEKRRFEESIRQRDRIQAESMAQLERQRADAQSQYENITRQLAEILGEIKAVQRSLIDIQKSTETSRADTTGGK